jgi:hypothetical protein
MKLSEYTHAVGTGARVQLKKAIKKLEAAGFTVISAKSYRSSVPNSYRQAYRVFAPYYILAPNGRLKMVQGRLENRSGGAGIPGHIVVKGTREDRGRVPEGMRACKYDDKNGTIDLYI